MSKSIRSSTPQFNNNNLPRFRRLDNEHIKALELLFKQYNFLNNRMEIHLPYHRAKQVFSETTIYAWPKFDKRPVGYLIFMDGFVPCIYYPERQEGLTLRWLLPPNFCKKGVTICLANILSGENTLQIEDLIVYEGDDLWSTTKYSERWEKLRELWGRIPSEQPLLSFLTRIVKPLTLNEWMMQYDNSYYWIFQHDMIRTPRWFWKDSVTPVQHKEFIIPQLKRNNNVTTYLCANCKPYSKLRLPDTYSLFSQENNDIGVAGINSLDLSTKLKKFFNENGNISVPVEVTWNNEFSKYQIVKILPNDTPITSHSFFNKSL